MIAILKGAILEKSPNSVVIMANGVGYLVHIPISTYVNLPENGLEVTLYTHTILKENALELYGFMTTREREIFKVLLGATGIGPRLALGILSGISTEELIQAIIKEDSKRLRAIPGVGRKLAERLVFELREKIGRFQTVALQGEADYPEEGIIGEAISALVNLGYPLLDARAVVLKAAPESKRLEDLIRASLRFLATG